MRKETVFQFYFLKRYLFVSVIEERRNTQLNDEVLVMSGKIKVED